MTAVAPDTRRALVESLVERYPDVPPEAVLKEDLLRTGIAFDDAALSDNLDGEVKPKSYFIFSFDQKPLTELGEAALRRPPEEVALTGGPFGLRRTIVLVLTSSSSDRDIEKSYDLGANAYLVKPSDSRELARIVQTLKDFWLTYNRPPPPTSSTLAQ